MNEIKSTSTFLFLKKKWELNLETLEDTERSARAIIWVPRRLPPAPQHSGWCARGRRLRSGGKWPALEKRGKNFQKTKNAPHQLICITFKR